MQRHEQMEEAVKQTALPDMQARHELAAPAPLQEAQATHAEPQSLVDLLAAAEKENALRRKWAPLSIFWLFVQAAILIASLHSPVVGLSYGFSVFLAVFLGSSFAIRYQKTTSALAAVDDIRMVGPLIDRLRPGSKARHTRRVVKQALMRLLPRLKASDASLLTAGQKAELVRYLGRLATFQRDKEFQVVILRALEQVGDAQAIPVVERIIQRQPHWSGQELVHSAAVECLPYLLQRAEEEQARNTLLRPAGKVGTDTHELLHPAMGASGTDPSQLLRGTSDTRSLKTSDSQREPEVP